MSNSRMEWGSGLTDDTLVVSDERPVLEIAPEDHIEITHHGVRERLNNRNSSIPRERVAALMIYAFEADNPAETSYEPLPEFVRELPIGISDFVHGWVGNNFEHMRSIIRDQHELRWHNEDVETAKLHERFEWAANALQIHAMQRLHEETLLARTGVELILLDALDQKTV